MWHFYIHRVFLFPAFPHANHHFKAVKEANLLGTLHFAKGAGGPGGGVKKFLLWGSNSGQGLLGRWLAPDLTLNTSPRKGRCWNWHEENEVEMKGERWRASVNKIGFRCRDENVSWADSHRELTVQYFSSDHGHSPPRINRKETKRKEDF